MRNCHVWEGRMKNKIFIFVFISIVLMFFPLNAQTWNAAKRLTWSSGGSQNPAIATESGNNIHLVWYDGTPGNNEIYYRKSTNGGGSWGGARRLTWTSDGSYHPAVVTDSSSNIHVVWFDYTPGNCEIFYKRSTDGGVNWSGTRRLSLTSGDTHNPAIATDSSGNIHVTWHDYTPGNSEIYYRRSTDGGVSWSGTRRLSWTSEGSYDSSIAIDSGDNIHVVWDDYIPGNGEIYYRRSMDGGVSWSGTRRLTWTSGGSYYASIAINSGNNIHLVWYDGTPGNNEIYFKRSTDGGLSWSEARRLTWTSGSSYDPGIAADSGNNIHVVWYDKISGNWEIYYRRSTDGGVNWSGTKRLTWNSGGSHYPFAATDASNNIHVFWHDNTPGNFEIYYKKGIQ